MKRGLLAKLEDLEFQVEASHPKLLYCGCLACDYEGERHYVRVGTRPVGSAYYCAPAKTPYGSPGFDWKTVVPSPTPDDGEPQGSGVSPDL